MKKDSKNKAAAKTGGSDGVKKDTPTKSPKKNKKESGKSGQSSSNRSAANTPTKSKKSAKDAAATAAAVNKKAGAAGAADAENKKAATAADAEKKKAAAAADAEKKKDDEVTAVEKKKAAAAADAEKKKDEEAAAVAADAQKKKNEAADLRQARLTQESFAADAAAAANAARLSQNAEKDKARQAEIERLKKTRQSDADDDKVEVVDTTQAKSDKVPKTLFQQAVAATPQVDHIMAEADSTKNNPGSGDEDLPSPTRLSNKLKPTKGHSPNKDKRSPPGFQMPPFVSNYVYSPSRARGAPGPRKYEGHGPSEFDGNTQQPPSIREPAGPSRPHTKPLTQIIRDRSAYYHEHQHQEDYARLKRRRDVDVHMSYGPQAHMPTTEDDIFAEHGVQTHPDQNKIARK